MKQSETTITPERESLQKVTFSPEQESKESIRSFKFHASQEELDDLRRRILATRFPNKEPVDDNSQGVPNATAQKLARYWANEYDWRKVEERINSYPNFITEIDGLDIHFIHVRSRHADALPIIVTHGWPGSIVEQLKIIEPLVNPTEYGGSASDAFHVVIPSIPGYGFSGKPTSTGWDPGRIGRAWAVLMERLGYERYVAQGGDWGAVITDVMSSQGHPGLIGMHSNMAGVIPAEINAAAFVGKQQPIGLSSEEAESYEALVYFYKYVYYALYMGSRPQTMTGLADSPVALAAMMIDHDARSLELIERVFEGKEEGLTRDDVLDNVTLFWLTNTGVSAARLYWENKYPFFEPKNVTIPVAISVFPDELYPAPKSWAEKAYPNLMYYKRHPKGGHFAAWEQPKFLSEDIREAFKTLR